MELKTWTQVIYALHAFSLLTGILGAATVVGAFLTGWPSIIAVILNYVKRAEARGTLAGVALPLADPDVLVRVALDRALRPLHHRDLGNRHPHCVAANGSGGTLVHLSDRSRLDGAQRRPADVRDMSERHQHTHVHADGLDIRIPIASRQAVVRQVNPSHRGEREGRAPRGASRRRPPAQCS